MPPVDAEVSVGREQDNIRSRLGHSDETSISQADGDIGKFLHEGKHRIEVIAEVERAVYGAAADKLGQR